MIFGHRGFHGGLDGGDPRHRDPAHQRLSAPTRGFPRDSVRGAPQGGSAARALTAEGSTPAQPASQGRGAQSAAPPARPARGRGGAAAAAHWRRSTAAAAAVGTGDRGFAQAAPAPLLACHPARQSAGQGSLPPPAAAAAESAVPPTFQVGVLAAEGTPGAHRTVPAPWPGVLWGPKGQGPWGTSGWAALLWGS